MIIHNDLQDAERTLLGTGGDIGGDGDAGAAMDASLFRIFHFLVAFLLFRHVPPGNKGVA